MATLVVGYLFSNQQCFAYLSSIKSLRTPRIIASTKILVLTLLLVKTSHFYLFSQNCMNMVLAYINKLYVDKDGGNKDPAGYSVLAMRFLRRPLLEINPEVFMSEVKSKYSFSIVIVIHLTFLYLLFILLKIFFS